MIITAKDLRALEERPGVVEINGLRFRTRSMRPWTGIEVELVAEEWTLFTPDALARIATSWELV